MDTFLAWALKVLFVLPLVLWVIAVVVFVQLCIVLYELASPKKRKGVDYHD